jgi:branched-chain amino acid aminotransferase
MHAPILDRPSTADSVEADASDVSGNVPRLDIAVHRAPASKARPAQNQLGFGRHFTDHLFRMDYTPESGWNEARVEPYAPLALDPAAAVLHYAQAIFEGLKAFRGTDGHVRTFRLLDHCRRFARSAVGLGMPPIEPERMAEAILALVREDAAWVPSERGTALYLRPTLIATEPFLGVRAAEHYTCFVIASPVGPYYGGAGHSAVRLWVERRRVRASPGGLGAVKAAANYAASLPAALDARRKGYDQVLWLDATEHRFVEEVGTMNLFVRIGDEVLTPPLGGTILAGMTRDSALTLLREWGVKVSERPVSIDEIRDAHASGQLKEVFGAGTAAVISPVGVLGSEDGDIIVGDGSGGEIAQRLSQAISAIQYGDAPDTHGWMTLVV